MPPVKSSPTAIKANESLALYTMAVASPANKLSAKLHEGREGDLADKETRNLISSSQFAKSIINSENIQSSVTTSLLAESSKSVVTLQTGQSYLAMPVVITEAQTPVQYSIDKTNPDISPSIVNTNEADSQLATAESNNSSSDIINRFDTVPEQISGSFGISQPINSVIPAIDPAIDNVIDNTGASAAAFETTLLMPAEQAAGNQSANPEIVSLLQDNIDPPPPDNNGDDIFPPDNGNPQPVQNPPAIPVISLNNITGAEDQPALLNINLISDTAPGVITTIIIAGLPSGATLSAGTLNSNGTYSLIPSELPGLSIIPPLNASGEYNLTITATSVSGGQSVSSSTNLQFDITPVADAPNVDLQNMTATEDSPVTLNINVTPVDSSSAALTINISGIPTGAIISAGLLNNDGSYTLTPAELTGLILQPPANFSGTINLAIAATSYENGTTATTTSNLSVIVTGIADAPALYAQSTTGSEDTAIALNINSALVDNDGSENLSINISGVPTGAVLSAGIHNLDGTWTLTPDQLSSLTLTPTSNYSGIINLTITAISSEDGTTATTTSNLSVTVTGVADAPTVSAQSTTGSEDTAIALNIASALTNTEGSESLSINISGVPTGAVLSAGIHNSDGSWTLTPDQLSGLTLTPASNYSGTINLTIAATSSEDGTTATTTSNISVTVTGMADAPALSAQSTTGSEDTAIALNIASALTDSDGSESLSVYISGVPNDAILSAGVKNQNGSWTLTSDQLSGLTLTPPLIIVVLSTSQLLQHLPKMAQPQPPYQIFP